MFEWKERTRTPRCAVIAIAVLFAATAVACGADEDDSASTYSNVPNALPGTMSISDCEINDLSPAEWAGSLELVVIGTISSVSPHGLGTCEENTVPGIEIQLQSVESVTGVAPSDELTFILPGTQVNEWLPFPIWEGQSVTWFPEGMDGAVAPGMRVMAGLQSTTDGYVTPNTHLALVIDDTVFFQGSRDDVCAAAPLGDVERQTIPISAFSDRADALEDLIEMRTEWIARIALELADQNYVRCTSNGESFDDPCDTQADCLSSQTCIDGSCIDD